MDGFGDCGGEGFKRSFSPTVAEEVLPILVFGFLANRFWESGSGRLSFS